jgi:hypothetical protein
VTSGSRAVESRDGDRRLGRETKPSFKTTELIVYVLSVLGLLIASLVVDVNEDGQRFSAYQGWFLVTLLTIGYLISRGWPSPAAATTLAKPWRCQVPAQSSPVTSSGAHG